MCSYLNNLCEAGRIGWSYLTQGSQVAYEVATAKEQAISFFCKALALKPDAIDHFAYFAQVAGEKDCLMASDPCSGSSPTTRVLFSCFNQAGCLCTKVGNISKAILQECAATHDKQKAFSLVRNVKLSNCIPRSEYVSALKEFCTDNLAKRTYAFFNTMDLTKVFGVATTSFLALYSIKQSFNELREAAYQPSAKKIATAAAWALASAVNTAASYSLLT